MRILNEERKQARNDPLKEREVEDMVEMVSNNQDSKGQTKHSFQQQTTKSEKNPKPVTLNQLLTSSVGKLTLNPYIKTLIHTNEYNSSINNTMKDHVKMLKQRKEEIDINMIHYNTKQLDNNKDMIENNAQLK